MTKVSREIAPTREQIEDLLSAARWCVEHSGTQPTWNEDAIRALIESAVLNSTTPPAGSAGASAPSMRSLITRRDIERFVEGSLCRTMSADDQADAVEAFLKCFPAPAPQPEASKGANEPTGADLSVMAGANRHKQAPSELVDGPETQTLGHSSSAPSAGKVEEAMERINEAVDDSFSSRAIHDRAQAKKDEKADYAALATLRAALEKRCVTATEVENIISPNLNLPILGYVKDIITGRIKKFLRELGIETKEPKG